jgi:hypothetical protein
MSRIIVNTTIQLSKTGRETRFLNVHFETVDSRDTLPNGIEVRIAHEKAIITVESPHSSGARSMTDIDSKVITDLI